MGDILHFLRNVEYGALIQRLFSASTILVIKLQKPLKTEPPHTIEFRMVFLWAHIMNYSPFHIVQIIDFFWNFYVNTATKILKLPEIL